MVLFTKCSVGAFSNESEQGEMVYLRDKYVDSSVL